MSGPRSPEYLLDGTFDGSPHLDQLRFDLVKACEAILQHVDVVEQVQHDPRLRRDDVVEHAGRSEEVRVTVSRVIRPTQHVAIAVCADAPERVRRLKLPVCCQGNTARIHTARTIHRGQRCVTEFLSIILIHGCTFATDIVKAA